MSVMTVIKEGLDQILLHVNINMERNKEQGVLYKIRIMHTSILINLSLRKQGTVTSVTIPVFRNVS